MSEITASQLSEFQDPYAFAITKTSNDTPYEDGTDVVKTDSLDDSYALISGGIERLITIESNLNELSSYTEEALEYTTSDERKNEIYGILRSLTAGIDILTDETTYNEENILNGNQLNLQTGISSGISTILNPGNYAASAEDGLNLSQKIEDTQAYISYDNVDILVNAQSGIIGLDISNVETIEATNTSTLPLSEGEYNVKVTYDGPDSSVSIYDENGILIETVENIDLTGEGTETVQFTSGVELEFEKDDISYDYESDGPTTLQAHLTYENIYRHELNDDSDESGSDESIGFLVDPLSLSSTSGDLSFSGIELSDVADDSIAIEEGIYSIEVFYREGENSSIMVYDRNSLPVSVLGGLDLSTSGEQTIDLGIGASITLNNDNFSGTQGRMSATISYQAEIGNGEVFDFEAYQNKINDALEDINTEIISFESVQQDILTSNEVQQSALSGTSSSVSATSLLSSSSSAATSLLGSTSSSQSAFTTSLILLQSANQSILGQGSINATSLISLLGDSSSTSSTSSLLSTLTL